MVFQGLVRAITIPSIDASFKYFKHTEEFLPYYLFKAMYPINFVSEIPSKCLRWLKSTPQKSESCISIQSLAV